MKITESQLRNIIHNVLKESIMEMPKTSGFKREIEVPTFTHEENPSDAMNAVGNVIYITKSTSQAHFTGKRPDPVNGGMYYIWERAWEEVKNYIINDFSTDDEQDILLAYYNEESDMIIVLATKYITGKDVTDLIEYNCPHSYLHKTKNKIPFKRKDGSVVKGSSLYGIDFEDNPNIIKPENGESYHIKAFRVYLNQNQKLINYVPQDKLDEFIENYETLNQEYNHEFKQTGTKVNGNTFGIYGRNGGSVD